MILDNILTAHAREPFIRRKKSSSCYGLKIHLYNAVSQFLTVGYKNLCQFLPGVNNSSLSNKI